MKFKSPTDEPVYVALLSGHCAVVGQDWRELPLNLHRRALEEGCITDNMDAATITSKMEFAAPPDDNHDILIAHIKSMADNPQDGDFTANDLPNLKRLSKLAGWSVSREEMMQAVYAIASESNADTASAAMASINPTRADTANGSAE